LRFPSSTCNLERAVGLRSGSPAMAARSSEWRFDTPLHLKNEWAGFDLTRVHNRESGQVPIFHRRGAVSVLSGCITTVAPMKNQAGWDLSLGWIDPRCCPEQGDVPFMAPTMMSRYEGIYQNGTSTVLKPNNQLYVNFSKNANPMVLHFSGLVVVHASHADEPVEIPVAQYEMREWTAQSGKATASVASDGLTPWALSASETKPPALVCCGDFVCLQGELQEAVFGPLAQIVGTLPEAYRPKREIRGLAHLLRADENDCNTPLVEHMVALTIRPDGCISVQGGKQQMIDSKGVMRLLQQKKKGRMSLDGLRFSLVDGVPIELAPRIAAGAGEGASARRAPKAKLDYLMSSGSKVASTAACIRQDDIVLLEGHLAWSVTRTPNSKQPLATLPKGCWPSRREIFFTRGSSDVEERRRVDVDKYGRIFCPEGVHGCRLELSGIIFIAAPVDNNLKPPDPEWDELRLAYHNALGVGNSEATVLNTSFGGHELLEAFVRRSNFHEWHMLQFDLKRHAFMDIMMPFGGQAHLRGWRKDPFNLGETKDNPSYKVIWERHMPRLKERSITNAYTLLHLTDPMFGKITKEVGMSPDEISFLEAKRRECRQVWETQRKPGMTFEYLEDLAVDIVDQMFEHWDFPAQLQGALRNDCKVPASIEHLIPKWDNPFNEKLIKKNISREDMAKFDEIRQFFFLYETTGCNMTHCSLMGSQDVFTNTGKWHFPDSQEVQKQLFENIAWLFPKKMYLYISERQTQMFPFIEDLDIQASTNYQEWAEGETPKPPDRLIMDPPKRVTKVDPVTGRQFETVEGDPGELMRKRAMAVHMVYPQLERLECLVYSASGYNKGKEMLKSSFHLVWPQLIVDPDRAPLIRYTTLGLFQRETARPGSFLSGLQTRLLALHESNNWELVFDNTTIHARNGLRLPYSDKASSVICNPADKQAVKDGTMSKSKAPKKRMREDRPSKAIGRIIFEFDKDAETGNDALISAKWDADEASYPIAEWIGMGTCRRDLSACLELTPWQLGPDVLEMLPFKPGERMVYSEGFDDGEGGHWVTHRPFPNIRRCNLEAREFQRAFSDAIAEEQNQLEEEKNDDLLRRIIGTWVSVDKKQAIWRAHTASQCPFKSLPCLRAAHVAKKQGSAWNMQRPVEVVYLKGKGKVIVDGPQEVVEAVLRALRPFTRPDDNAVMPIYDLQKISKPP